MLVVAKGHDLAKRDRISFAETLDYNFVGIDRASAIQRFLADKANRIGRPLRLRVQLRSFDAVCRMVENHVGVGVVPLTTARWAAKTMAIHAVDLTDPWAVRNLSICVRDYNALPPYARQLVDHLRAVCEAKMCSACRPQTALKPCRRMRRKALPSRASPCSVRRRSSRGRIPGWHRLSAG